MDRSIPLGEQILVIEDNRTNRELMVYLLNTFGYSTCQAENGRVGVEMARQRLPRLVVCDIQVPELDGYEVIQELKLDEYLRDVPVVAVTALAMVGDRDRILAAGFNGYVAKPISPETFVSELEKFLPPEKRAVTRDVAMPAASLASRTAASKSSAARGCGTLVLVDDVPENLEFACSTLQPSGYAVFTATNVEHGVALMREKKPDAVLCDLNMEPESGLDLLDRGKSDPKLRRVPVVIISSTATETEVELKCLEGGATHFIRRPIEREMLLAEIEKILRRTAVSAG